MSPEALAAVMSVCLTVLAALILVLHHLKALHLTKTQAEELRSEYMSDFAVKSQTSDMMAKDLEDTKAKLSALSNRVRT